LQAIVAKVESGTLKAGPKRVFRFDEIAEAHDLMDAGEAEGKLVVEVFTQRRCAARRTESWRGACAAWQALRPTCYGRNFAGKLSIMPLLSMAAMPSACR
jgi:hypothetical protein